MQAKGGPALPAPKVPTPQAVHKPELSQPKASPPVATLSQRPPITAGMHKHMSCVRMPVRGPASDGDGLLFLINSSKSCRDSPT